jgi:methanogenic corrinoid protein MtbC1
MSGLICENLLGTILPKQNTLRSNHSPIAIVLLEDHHPLGKKTVSSLVRSAGYELIDYGQGVTVDDLIPMLKRDRIRVLLISTLMLRSALRVKDLMDRINEEELNVKVVVGGAPFLFDDTLWKDVGADAMARTASDAVVILERMVGEAG